MEMLGYSLGILPRWAAWIPISRMVPGSDWAAVARSQGESPQSPRIAQPVTLMEQPIGAEGFQVGSIFSGTMMMGPQGYSSLTSLTWWKHRKLVKVDL